MPLTHRRRALPAATACVVLAAATAPAVASAAATVTTPDRCFVHWPGQGSQPIPVTLGGLTPGQAVRIGLLVGGRAAGGVPSVTADASGAVSTTLPRWAPGMGSGPTEGVDATIAVSDVALGTPVASASVRVVTAGLSIDQGTKRFGKRRRWIVSGLSPLGGGQRYHAFYFQGRKLAGHQVLGRPDDCGYLRTRALLIPFSRVGTFALKVQASPRFSSERPWMGGTVEQTALR